MRTLHSLMKLFSWKSLFSSHLILGLLQKFCEPNCNIVKCEMKISKRYLAINISVWLTPSAMWMSFTFPFICWGAKHPGLLHRKLRIWHITGHLLFGFEVMVMTVEPLPWNTVRDMMLRLTDKWWSSPFQ